MSSCVFERVDASTVRCALCGLVVKTETPHDRVRASCRAGDSAANRRRRRELRESERREAAAAADMPTVAANAHARALESQRHRVEGKPLRQLSRSEELLEASCRACVFFTGAGCRHPMKCCEAAEAFIWADVACPAGKFAAEA